MALLDEFIAEECTPHVVDVLHVEASGASGERYLTFNRFNLRLDIDRGVATIEDELDPESEQSLPIDDLLSALPGGSAPG